MGMKTGFARTCAGAQGRLQVLTPAEDCGIQHRIDHRKTRRRRSGQDRRGRVGRLRGHGPVVRHRGSLARDQASRESDRLSVGASPSQRRGVLTLRLRCFGVSRLPSVARLRPEQW
jgi:hypothetical protein